MKYTKGFAKCIDLGRDSINAGVVKSITTLSEAVSYKRPYPIYFNTHHATETARGLIHQYFEATSQSGCQIDLYDFPNAFVFGQGTVVLKDDRILFDSAAEFLNHNLPPTSSHVSEGGFVIDNVGDIESIFGSSLLVKRPWYQNFGHSLVDLIPIILLAAHRNVPIDNIIFGKISSSKIRFLMMEVANKYFPNAKQFFLEDTRLYVFENLFYTKPVHVPPLFKHPSAIQETILYGLSKIPPTNQSSRRLFLDRQQLGGRQIQNIDILYRLLKNYGFEIITPEILSFHEQVEYFRSASVIMGVKGAALTNAMFCHAETLVFVLSPSEFVDPFFWDLLAPLSIKYAELFCQTSLQDLHSPSLCSFEVDTNLLAHALNGLGIHS